MSPSYIGPRINAEEGDPGGISVGDIDSFGVPGKFDDRESLSRVRLIIFLIYRRDRRRFGVYNTYRCV